LREFFAFLVEEGTMTRRPVLRHRHHVAAPMTLPKPMPEADLVGFFKVVDSLRDRLLFLLMLRCGLRVSEAARLKASNVDGEQEAILVRQGKGRKDRRVYISPDALLGLRECLRQRPVTVAGDYLFRNRKRPGQPLSIKATRKKMERYAKAARIIAGCHRLRHTFASNLLEEGAEVVSIKEFLGHSSVTSSERYARLSNRKNKQTYLETIRRVMSKRRL
jgi:site-specific recombinase XerD